MNYRSKYKVGDVVQIVESGDAEVDSKNEGYEDQYCSVVKVLGDNMYTLVSLESPEHDAGYVHGEWTDDGDLRRCYHVREA